MKIKVFRDRPRYESVRAVVYFEHAHVFFFHYGLTVRWRRPENVWRHATLYGRPRKGGGRGILLMAGTWLTENGAYKRIPYSKRYVLFKTLTGSR